MRFAILYGAVIAIIFFVSAPTLAGFFTKDPEVTRIFCAYVRIIAFGYGMMEVHRYGGFASTDSTDRWRRRPQRDTRPRTTDTAVDAGAHGAESTASLEPARYRPHLGRPAILWVRKLFKTDPALPLAAHRADTCFSTAKD